MLSLKEYWNDCLLVLDIQLLEKLEKLVDFQLDIKVIAKEVSNDFLEFAKRYNIEIEKRAYSKGDIKSFDIVVVATDTRDLHKEIYEESRSQQSFSKFQLMILDIVILSFLHILNRVT